ncbi:hypothetical protein CCB80_11135 [Armatimonadetes bacterium Uphvl-Ar1]|nr:hypothetical protein CCB80_11135 [Armatimonadetes bacterium Uphvl-Ar1]
MSASVLYTNFGGMLVHEDRGGVERTYVHDEMGNTSYLVDSNGVTDSYEYTPYGQVTHVGTSVTPFTFIGALGYFATGWSHLTSYVRARWYSRVSGAWGSVDPIWPWQKAYQYVDGNPAMYVDPSGLDRLSFGQAVNKILDILDKMSAGLDCLKSIVSAFGTVAGGGSRSEACRDACNDCCTAAIKLLFAIPFAILGAYLGGYVGGLVGAVLGSPIPGTGTAFGIVLLGGIGTVLGGFLGGSVGSKIGELVAAKICPSICDGLCCERRKSHGPSLRDVIERVTSPTRDDWARIYPRLR